MRVALYARVSTDQRVAGDGRWKDREYDQDPSLQLNPMHEYAEAQKWEIVGDRGPYTSPGITDYFDRASGAAKHRPAFERLLRDAGGHRFDAIMCWKFDRISRSTLQLIQTMEQLNHWNVGFVSLTERIDTTSPMGRVMFTVISAFAQFEREMIQQRVLAGIDNARRRGVTFGRPRIEVPVAAIQALLAKGLSIGQAAKAHGLSRLTVSRAIKRAEHAGAGE